MRIGALSKVFSRPTLGAVLDAMAVNGLECMQFNLESAGLPPMPDAIPAGLAARVRDAAAQRGIGIASVQGTFNMSHPDAACRHDGLERLRLIIGMCADLGAPAVAICIGTRNRDNMWGHHPDNRTPEAWRDMTACLREALRMAADANVTLAVEPEVTNLADSAASARRLLDEMASPHLKITMDGANLFHTGELPRMKAVLDEAFALVGKDIIIAHAKDLSHDGDAGNVAAGHGLLDYDHYLSLLSASGFTGPLLLHGLAEDLVPGCVAFLREKLARLA